MTRKTFYVSPTFPVEHHETFFVRDGQGRKVETWHADVVQVGKTSTRIEFEIDGYRDAEAL